MMKKSVTAICCAAALLVLAAGCKGRKAEAALEVKPVNGTIEQSLAGDRAPESVARALLSVSIDDRFENVLDENPAGIKIWSLLRCSDETSAEGFGIVAEKGSTLTTFPNVRHGNNPRAYFDNATGRVWLVGAASEGTGVRIECPYLLGFDEADNARIVTQIDPYDLQERLRERLSYSVEGKQVSFYAENRQIAQVVCSTTDMGNIYDDAVWIGEQISYDFDGQRLIAKVTPGVSFVTGKVLIYDDMPTFSIPVTVTDDGFELDSISLDVPQPDAEHNHAAAAAVAPADAAAFEGTFYDENGSPDLVIKRRPDGRYDVTIGIFRLTTLDDGVGEMTAEGLHFTATDAAGNPIGGIIKLEGNTATVVFTESTWGLINNGDSFAYTKK